MPNNSQNFFKHPLITLMLLLAASTPDPQGRLNNLGQAINSLRDAINSINVGMETFHSQVVPLFLRQPEQKK
ncbi:hypothetical protein IT084_10725 [Desulfallas sp. Bu1-1]|jgi:hypothetical protein|uniref:hypothetical protein n=1 Tax=Desulfallas sp. Bu1-1 TaxID=2787620 RepID=UPI00189CDA8B|nr:hypothetical protein [Desulfallas sp. Bu1-1]MBF7083446.1 hypothetical protein [Desulfallas sp. Bu1-1]